GMAPGAAARRLAQLTGARLGEVVGFTVRGQARTSARTRSEFVTTGVLLARLLRDPGLAGVRAVVLDEVHERQLDTDLAFAICRELIDLRSDPSLVVMSATLDARLWADRLGDGSPAPCLSVSADAHVRGVRCGPAKERPLDARGVTWASLDHRAATTVRALDECDDGDVLVFSPGAREVEKTAAWIRPRLGTDSTAGTVPGVDVHTLSGRTPAKEQDAILREDESRSARRRTVAPS